MSKRYIVAIDQSTKEQKQAFIDFIERNNLGWWSWIENFWLLTDSAGRLSASQIRDEVYDLFPDIHNLVIELSNGEDTWSGYGPKSEKRNMFTWLKETWTKYK